MSDLNDPEHAPIEACLQAQLCELDRVFYEWVARSRREGAWDRGMDMKVALRAQSQYRTAAATLKKLQTAPKESE